MLCEFLWKEAQEKKSSNNNTNNGADSSSNTNETTESSGDPQEPNSTKEEQAQPDAGDDDNNNMEETGEGPSSDATTIKTSESYDDYRLSYAWTFLKHFFNQHLDDSWFRQQYSPALLVAKATLERKRCHAEAVLLRQQVLSNVETTTKSQQEFMANVSLTVPSGGSLSSSLHNNSNHHGASGSFISMTQQPSPPQVPAQHLCDAFHRTLHIHHVPSHVNDEHLLQTLLPLLTDCYSLEQEKRNKKSSSSSQTAPSGGTKKKKTNYSPQEVMENCLLGLFSSTPHNSNHKRDAGLSGGAMHSTAVTPPRRGGSSVFLHRSVFCVCTTTEVCDGLWQLLIQRTANPEDPNHHHSKEGNNDPAHNNNNNNNNNMAGNPGLGTIADLRSRMQQQQQQQRQFGVFSIGNPQTTSMGPPGMAASSSSSGQSLQQKLASLAQLQQDMYQQQQQLQQQQEALMDQQQNGVFEFEPRPIAPGNEPNHVLPPVRSIGIESNQPPRKEQSHGRAAGAMDRQASEKSLEMDHIFEKAIHGGESEKDKMGASNASAMSISLGDMNADVDDPSSSMKPPPNRTFNLQEERQQNPNDLAERFNNSMKIKNQQQPAQKSGPEGFDMSVGTLGDSGNLFGNSNASMAFSEGSFGDIFDDNEKEAIVSSS
mmetsp:Transcript_21328/g.59063  ORF Transcript_21328/g.59063 Transcript_21328/m.59063 type:complete len:653 (-) Transcript_21328:295-2253(-)